MENIFRKSLGLPSSVCPIKREKVSECLNPSGEGKDSVCSIPTGGEKDSLYANPSGEGKTACVQSLQEREKTPCVQFLQEREKTPCVQFSNAFIPDQCFRLSSHPKPGIVLVGSRLRRFLPEWENQKTHRAILSLIQDGYKLPFRECPKLSRFSCITNGYAGSDKQNALLTSIQDLLQKGAIEVVHTKNSLGFYSQTRKPLEASHRPQFSKQIPGRTQIQDGNPRINTCLSQEGRVSYIHRPNRCLPTCP